MQLKQPKPGERSAVPQHQSHKRQSITAVFAKHILAALMKRSIGLDVTSAMHGFMAGV